MRPALRAKSGSRGKIQQRACEGRMAPWGGQQDHLGADNHEIRQRILGGAAAQLSRLSTRQPDPIWALPWHRSRVLPRNDHDATGGEAIQTYVSVFKKVGT